MQSSLQNDSAPHSHHEPEERDSHDGSRLPDSHFLTMLTLLIELNRLARITTDMTFRYPLPCRFKLWPSQSIGLSDSSGLHAFKST